jgi:3-oxoacyl-[acyl-carrier protein] reductase
MDLGINGRRAAVAAASAGLGLATAKALSREGVTVAICGRDLETIKSAAEEVGNGAVGLVVDVSTPEGGKQFVEEAAEALGGGIDILVANAGGPPKGGFHDMDIGDYQGALNLNLLSTVAMCKQAIPYMQSQRWGRVVAILSHTVKQPNLDLILSNTARAGLQGFLKTAALAVAADGVTVNSVLPGGHATKRLVELAGNNPEVVNTIPARRFGTPEEFGAIVAFLTSDHAGFMTATTIVMDGGAVLGLL